jgi:hypothetical protein
MYIQIQREGFSYPAVFSYPCRLNVNSNLQKNIKEHPGDVAPIYQVMKKKKEVVINYSNFDIGINDHRVITIAQPIINNNKFYGGIIWEQNIEETFKEEIIPQSFKDKRYPFI